MLRYAKIPLLFLFIGSLIGVFLRWQFISPTTGTNYTFFLHGHSHVMFLGWITNALYIAFVHNHIDATALKPYKNLFLTIQGLIVAMTVSFPIQGYGFYSILFSTLHTLCFLLFAALFFRSTRSDHSQSAWYARLSLVFFAVSTIGPFSLGYLMVNSLGHTNWHYFSIYFYLHFQYNGFFLFGIFSLLLHFLEKRNVNFDTQRVRLYGNIMAALCVPTYLLSVLWAKPGLSFNVIAGIAAALQLLALIIVFPSIKGNRSEIKSTFPRDSYLYISLALFAFVLKLILQITSSFPAAAQMAYELRPIVIAYLHLVLIGVVSIILLVWYNELGVFKLKFTQIVIKLFVIGFIVMEIALVISPWWTVVLGSNFFSSSQLLFIFSFLLSLICLFLVICTQSEKTDKSQELSHPPYF